MLDDEINRTIDDVACEMTVGEPALGFRARVVALIDARRHDRPRQWRPASAGLRWTIAAVVAALIVVMFFRDRVRLKPDAADTDANVQIRLKPDATETRAEPAITPPPNVRSRYRAAIRPTGAPYPSEVAALAPARLDVESIAFGGLGLPPSIEIEQLEAIAPIAIAPLSDSDRKEGDRP